MVAEEEAGASGGRGGTSGRTVMADGVVAGGAVATGAVRSGVVRTGGGSGEVGFVAAPEEELPVSIEGRRGSDNQDER